MSSRLRKSNLDKLTDNCFDVLIVGGGISGAVSAASLSARGLQVALIDRNDFASGASSQSSNLAWGGIKYLENYEFLLVNKLCKSRNLLMDSYPSTVKEIRFFTTIERGFRMWSFFVYLGSVLYWIMGRCKTRPPRYITSRGLERKEPAINTSNTAGGLEYSDCYLYDNDARFVFNFVRKSLNYGCIAANYVECLQAKRQSQHWQIRACDTISNSEFNIRAKVLINSSGAWVDELNLRNKQTTKHHHVFSKGIHLIVPRVTDNKRVLTFFASDGRLFFLVPMGPKTCIGTTDNQVHNPDVTVSEADREFVLGNANALLDLDPPLQKTDIIAERVGVRPLVVSDAGADADWVQLSRKHEIDVNLQQHYLSIFGGKLTDCINVGNEIADVIATMGIPIPHPDKTWYGEPGQVVRDDFMHQAALMNLDELTDPSSSEPLSERFWRRYGETAYGLLERIREDKTQAQLLIENAEYTRCEIELAARREMIVKLEDFMRRRSKIELVVRKADIANAPGLQEACDILFGDESEQKLKEYLHRLNRAEGT